MNTEKSLTVANIRQKIIFLCEMQGQISDGNWENAKPSNHWEDWCDLKWDDVTVNENVGVTGSLIFAKNNYNFSSRSLLEIVGYRTRVKVAMAILYPKVISVLETNHWLIPDDMNDYIAIKRRAQEGSEKYWCDKYASLIAAGITEELYADVIKRMETVYGETSLKHDCRELKQIIRTRKNV
jgi:hypothetical protein